MSGTNLRLTVRRAARLLERGLITSEQLAAFCHSLAVAGEEIWNLNAYTNVVDRDILLDQAHQSDIRRRRSSSNDDGRGGAVSILDGIPISIKSNIAVRDYPLTAGSRILGMGRKDAHPCGYDADTVRILTRNCGALLVGLTSMDEFGMGSLGNNMPAGIDGDEKLTSTITKNPLPYLKHLNLFSSAEKSSDEIDDDDEEVDAKLAEMIMLPHDKILKRHADAFNDGNGNNDVESTYSAGGSSCGSAASVAHGSAILSLGTDTGGSVRLPASWCSIVGLKPSYGLLSRHGIVSYASSFDTVGILGSSVDCVSLALEKLAQREGEESLRDSTFSSYPASPPPPKGKEDSSYTTMTTFNNPHGDSPLLNGIRIGIPSAFSVKECPPEIRQGWSEAAESLSIRGAEIVEIPENDIRPTVVQNALSAYYVLVSAEASSNLSRYDGFRYSVPEPSSDDQHHNSASSSSSSPDANDGEMMMKMMNVDAKLTPLEIQYARTRSQGFGKEVSRRVLCGTSVLSSDKFHTYYESAAKLRAILGRQLRQVLDEKVDLLLVPTALTLPCRLLENKNNDTAAAEIDSTESFANDVMTVGPSLAGLPAVSIPVSIPGESTFTAGLQLIGPRLCEDVMLDVGRVLEEANSNQ